MKLPSLLYPALVTVCAISLISGCGKANSGAPSVDASGSHPQGWVAQSGGRHPAAFFANAAQCMQCHGSDLSTRGSSGGISQVSCSSQSLNGTSCHPGGNPPVPVPHAIPFTDPALHGPPAKADLTFCQGCHATAGGAGSNPRFNLGLGALVNGCEDCHDPLTAHPASAPPNSSPWRGPVTHSNAGNLTTACALCHGATLAGGVGPACTGCHNSSPLTNGRCSSCHGSALAAATLGLPSGTTFPNIQGAHATHDPLANVTGVCATCHTGGGIGTVQHFNDPRTVNTGFPATYQAKTGGGASFNAAAGTCGNVSCHGGVVTPVWRTGLIDVSTDCIQCHQARSASDQFNSFFSGKPWLSGPGFPTLHIGHLVTGVICTDCHAAAVLDPATNPGGDHFKFLNTPAMEGNAAATIRADVNYTGSVAGGTTSCAPSNTGANLGICHGANPAPRSWTQ